MQRPFCCPVVPACLVGWRALVRQPRVAGDVARSRAKPLVSFPAVPLALAVLARGRRYSGASFIRNKMLLLLLLLLL